MDRLRILNLPVAAISMNEALRLIDDRVRDGHRAACIVCANPEKVYAVRSNVGLGRFFEEAELVIPDGIGVVLAARVLYGAKLMRIPGADLMQQICAASAEKGYRLFIYGSSERVNRAAVETLQSRYPGINIAGRSPGYVKQGEMGDLVRRINESGADILFVGLGSPRQELWMQQYVPKLNVKVCQTIGGTLDTIAGAVKRAPRWMRGAGLEWLYRLLRQPWRVSRQINLVRFTAEVIRMKAWRGSV